MDGMEHFLGDFPSHEDTTAHTPMCLWLGNPRHSRHGVSETKIYHL